uniref:Late embryogenesis abundant protein LEA-2 subgroup domain-containing protein n=2 Tax=Chenopodium quinoa TaxID=63459 RepID=A0A803KZV2_CHEQI
MPPQQPLQPPQQLSQPPPQPPLQPPQQIFLPTSPPPKSRAPPKHNRSDDDDDDDDNNKSGRLLCAVITALLILIGITVLILWLLYRPAKPQFTAVSAAVYSLNTTSPPATFITTSVQLTILTRNPSKRTAIHYDRLTVAVHYRNHPITPPAPLPPLHQRRRSTVMMSPVIGGGAAVATPPEVVEGLAADEAYGVVGLSWVLMGRVRYKAGWFKSGHSRVYVRCDVMLGFKNGGGSNPNGQVPLLRNPPCYVDI